MRILEQSKFMDKFVVFHAKKSQCFG